MFVSMDTYLNAELPPSEPCEVVLPKTKLLGVSPEEIRGTKFCKVSFVPEDFTSQPKKMPRLLLVNKEAFKTNPEMVATLAPVVLVAATWGERTITQSIIGGMAEASAEKLWMLTRDNFIVLLGYCTFRACVGYYGVATRKRFSCNASGALNLQRLTLVAHFVLGENYPMYHHDEIAFWRPYALGVAMHAGLHRRLETFDLEEASVY